MRKLLFIFMVLALAACSLGSQSEIDRNQQKWQDANISHYRFNLSIGCFCPFSQDMPLVIEVQNGKVVSMVSQSGNEIDANNREIYKQYETIDRVLSELEKAIKGTTDEVGSSSDPAPRKADEVVVTYDPTYGFPAQAQIDFIKNAVDDELTLDISNFEKLP
ncbi:MAG TPA: DUF6174 domain-containing protein [Anaerolineales bacterium]|nr:DUF6174 domain-containing protein [Anaerolineales bacterium]